MTLEDTLDNYFVVNDPEDFVALDYSFAEAEESDIAQSFMVAMALLYHAIRDYCQNKQDTLLDWASILRDFYSGHIPELPAPLPCVEMVIPTDAGQTDD